MMYRVHLAMSGIPTHILVVIGSDCTYSCTIRTTTTPYKLLTSGIYHCHLKILLQITFKYQNNWKYICHIKLACVKNIWQLLKGPASTYPGIAHSKSVFQFLICRKHLHDSIISLRGEVWPHKTSLTPPLFITLAKP